MEFMGKVIVFAGSSSKHSINKQLAKYAAGFLSKNEIEVLDLNDYPLPVFSVDVEKESGFPENATSFSQKIEQCSGIIISMAEHNGSYTAVFKNLFDWLSRIEAKTWRSKPMLLLSTSPGGRGGKNVMQAALTRFPVHDAQIISNFSLPYFNDNFKNEQIINESLKKQLIDATTKFEQSLQ